MVCIAFAEGLGNLYISHFNVAFVWGQRRCSKMSFLPRQVICSHEQQRVLQVWPYWPLGPGVPHWDGPWPWDEEPWQR